MNIRTYLGYSLTIISGIACMLAPTFADSFVPEEYYANYHIAQEWSELLDLIIDIDAAWKVGAEVEPETFADLHDIFEVVFEYFPSDPASELTYRKCLLTTQEIKDNLTRNEYAKFREQCFNPISSLLNKIRSDYTVKPSIITKPKQGNSPLNVTFDARNSVDPSNDTIPSDYYYRRYKDVYGDEQVLGKGPVVNYTFEEEGNHIVHLTVRSSNNLDQGIFDGTEFVSVNVAPKSAEIIVYANNKQLTTDDTVRIGTQDAKDGILMDGTATRPTGARTIIEYVRTITSNEVQYNFKKSGEGSPGQFVHAFPRNGVYQVQLELKDNENNRIIEKYNLSVSDPVASIKFQPTDGTTSDTYSFDASASYSLTSRVKKYQRDITDPSGERIDILESKQIKRKFTSPGTYTVKLTVFDELGHASYDTEQFYVASTPPIPSFTIESSTDLKHPSEFFLDAGVSFDDDILNGNDELSYYRSFAPTEQVTILSQDAKDKRILVTFDAPGSYTAKLRVEDVYGEIAEIEKDIEVESTLRPELYVSPLVAQRGTKMDLTASTNKPVSFYEWNLGDGKSQQSNDPSISYTYTKAGVYTVALKVVSEGEENIVHQQVFMGQQDMPIVSYEIKGKQNKLLQPTGSCLNSSGSQIQAYEIDRYETFLLDTSSSLDTQGTKKDVVVNVHPNNDEVYTKNVLNYDFREIGCTYIDIFAEDTNAGKTEKKKVWFDVKNALPTISNLVLDFPQPGGGNDVGVGVATQTVSNRDVFTDASIDPVVVKVQAKGARDADGFISHYAWYYYESANPDNIISLKITPADVPYTSFIIPKPHNPTEYAFAVRMVDNDGGEVTSEDVLGKGPIIFFPPGENSLDVPVVSLKANVYQAKVGDEVAFTTDARILSQKPDFATTRYFKYDFDGDGQYDLTSKQPTVTHRYEKSGEVKPKVAVYYRGRAGIGLADSLIIQKGLKPVLLYDTFGTHVLVRDASLGDIEDSTLCMDIRECRGNTDRVLKNQEIVDFTYEKAGSYFMQFDIIDAFGNSQNIREKITLEEEQGLGILSVPQAIKNVNDIEISVGSSLRNEIVFHVVYEAGNCYGDIDIAHDGDNDGDPTNDDDLTCNQSVPIAFRPTSKTQTARIHYVEAGEKKEQDIQLSFLDYEDVTPEEYLWAVDEIDAILSLLSIAKDDEVLGFYRDLLLNLKVSLGETDEMNSLLIQLRDVLAERPDLLTTSQQERVMNLINSLSDETVKQVYGGTEYDTAKSNILAWFDEDVAQEIAGLFVDFENAEGNKDERKRVLDEIFKVTGREKQAGTIDAVDFAYVQKNLCDVIVYYELPSKTCGTEIDLSDPDIDTSGGDDDDGGSESTGNGKKILRIVLIVVVILAVIFGILVVLFAIKAKRERDDDDEDYDDDDEPYDDFDVTSSDESDEEDHEPVTSSAEDEEE